MYCSEQFIVGLNISESVYQKVNIICERLSRYQIGFIKTEK